jgi:site-specific DNA-methyltransferase (adenine-specific)
MKYDLNAEIVDLSELLDDPENANLGTERGADALDLSISEFGFLEPGVIGGDNIVISGNKRKASANRNGIDKAVIVDLPEGAALYVRKKSMNISDPDDLKARRAAIALNRVGQLSLKWNPEVTEAMEAKGVSFKGLFEEKEIPHIHLRKKESQSRVDVSELEKHTEELRHKWNVSAGQVWRIGPHYIACGDCRDASVWAGLFVASQVGGVNGIFTSPPYAEQRNNTYGGVPAEGYVEWWDALQRIARDSLLKDGSFFVNIKPHTENGQRSLYVNDLVAAMARKWNWLFVDELCWERVGNPGSWPNRFKNGFEPVYHFSLASEIKFRPRAVSLESSGSVETGSNENNGSHYNMANKHFEWERSLPSNVLPFKKIDKKNSHSAAFPIDLPDFFVRAYSDPGDVWLDTFSGSGTTVLAAANNGRIGLGIELMPGHVAVSLERLQTELEEEPVLCQA